MSSAQMRCPSRERVHNLSQPRLPQHRATKCSAQLQEGHVRDVYPRSPFVTGGRFGTSGSSRSLVPPDRLPLLADKQIVFVRHGTTTWNNEKRIQGSSDESHLTDYGRDQALATRQALANMPFKACFSSPISRARECAELIWDNPDIPITYDDSLREAYLGHLQGMKNSEAADQFPDVYGSWRADPAQFEIEGRRPIHEVFHQAGLAWQRIILHPSDVTLVVTHKSVLRALVCTALGLGPEAFRAVDVHNAGVTVFWVNRNGEAMLQSLNMTSHLYTGLPY
eukprot:jgi/Ulvmu1/3414/UM016_0032.1